jgi:hypothetical protein
MTKKNNFFGRSYAPVIGEASDILPHAFANRIVARNGQPKIMLTLQAYQDMNKLVSMFKTEVGWLGTVERKGNTFLIKEVFLFEQRVNGTKNIIQANTILAWASEIMEEREDCDEIINSLKFWGHSHATFPTSPSERDEYQMQIFEKRCHDFFIRGIANRLGRLEFTLYLYKEGLEIHDCNWFVQVPAISSERNNFWATEAKKVSLLSRASASLSREFNEEFDEYLEQRQ